MTYEDYKLILKKRQYYNLAIIITLIVAIVSLPFLKNIWMISWAPIFMIVLHYMKPDISSTPLAFIGSTYQDTIHSNKKLKNTIKILSIDEKNLKMSVKNVHKNTQEKISYEQFIKNKYKRIA